MNAGADGAPAGRRIRVTGIAQGVGFRPFVYRLASEEGLTGSVRNDPAGVTIEAFGSPEALDRFITRLAAQSPPAARLERVQATAVAFKRRQRFEIAPNGGGEARQVSIPPDIATCAACRAEIFDASNRRYRYAFTNCTNCGPRYTITRDIPYDRAGTTMAPFEMCPECRREYESPADRRFHAEPNACPRCGPQLTLTGPGGAPARAADPIRAAAAALAAGSIVAIKGIGGFHLACDATDAAAVGRLRWRKRREEKPLAVMVGDLEAAERLVVLDHAERKLLLSSERPIVLARRRAPAPIAPQVAPHNPLLGVLLPYSPLHHLLMAEMGRPLVMTSGNLSEEPIARENREALSRLRAVADLFVLHDRDIVGRCDDSVARVIAGAPVVLRRARGYVPRPIAMRRPFAYRVLGLGAQLKSAICLGVGPQAHLGAHIGDLENLDTFEAFEESIARLERFLDVRPEIVAHDLHPDYLSTLYARSRSGVARVAVQHHHAHVASAMAERGLSGPVLGVAFDGTGYGTDGRAWGGELLWADLRNFTRIATFRPIALGGGDAAIRKVWRIALALLDDAFNGAPPLDRIALFDPLDGKEVEVVRRMIGASVNAPLAHGVGRYFDAFGAIALGLAHSRYEAQVAMRLEWTADPSERRRWGYEIDRRCSPWQVDLRGAMREAVGDLLGGAGAAVIAARFHNTMVAATAALVRAAAAEYGRAPVILSGGCFQNARLTEGVVAALAPDFEIHRHGEVPPGDGGIALGQAVVADARARES